MKKNVKNSYLPFHIMLIFSNPTNSSRGMLNVKYFLSISARFPWTINCNIMSKVK